MTAYPYTHDLSAEIYRSNYIIARMSKMTFRSACYALLYLNLLYFGQCMIVPYPHQVALKDATIMEHSPGLKVDSQVSVECSLKTCNDRYSQDMFAIDQIIFDQGAAAR